jgi:hypothetical protein
MNSFYVIAPNTPRAFGAMLSLFNYLLFFSANTAQVPMETISATAAPETVPLTQAIL